MATQQEATTYIALFHHRDHAAAAIRDLEKSGFSSGALTLIGGGNGASYTDAHGQYGSEASYGDASGLSEIGVPDRDRKHLQEGIDQGGTVLVLKGAGERAEEIEAIFHKHSTGKIDETNVERTGAAPGATVASTAPSSVESMVIPVAEEELVVGKRQVDRGGVRVFRRTVEEPVTQSVSLHEEHVVIECRPVNRAVTDAELRQGDQNIELTETAEEAVVGKTARVVEEVRVGKQESDHTETIRDTVRHTEVDVEQMAGSELNDSKLRKQ